jgi:hypothetical protein
VAEGFLLPADAQALITQAQASTAFDGLTEEL